MKTGLYRSFLCFVSLLKRKKKGKGANSFFQSIPLSIRPWHAGVRTESHKNCFPCETMAKIYHAYQAFYPEFFGLFITVWFLESKMYSSWNFSLIWTAILPNPHLVRIKMSHFDRIYCFNNAACKPWQAIGTLLLLYLLKCTIGKPTVNLLVKSATLSRTFWKSDATYITYLEGMSNLLRNINIEVTLVRPRLLVSC